MLKIAELRAAMETAETAFDNALAVDAPRATIRKFEKAMHAAQAAYQAEREKVARLRAEYEAMGDEDGIGATNASDTLDAATYGDARFGSSEYWQIAIDSVLVVRECQP